MFCSSSQLVSDFGFDGLVIDVFSGIGKNGRQWEACKIQKYHIEINITSFYVEMLRAHFSMHTHDAYNINISYDIIY